MAQGPNRTQWQELDDPRSGKPYGGSDIWSNVVRTVEAIHSPGAEMQGSSSFVREGDQLRPLPPFE